MKKPKEDPADKAARMRERRITELEQQQTAQETAKGLTTDLRSVYGVQSLIGMSGANKATKPGKTPSIFDLGKKAG